MLSILFVLACFIFVLSSCHFVSSCIGKRASWSPSFIGIAFAYIMWFIFVGGGWE